jgi:excinuclease ABC subunit A
LTVESLVPDGKIIRVTAARQHNLQNVSVDIPRDKLVVLTGLSGSGKSSLAFDTLYAEGQRKYVESLSIHARYFLEQVAKPDVDRIEGLPPTLAIEQRASAVSPRSTVATTTEIYDFLRLLLARVGTPHCPTTGEPLARRTVDQIVDEVLEFPEASRVMVLAPLIQGHKGEHKAVARRIQREGFVRARVNGELIEVQQLLEMPENRKLDIDVVVDRIVVRPDSRHRLADAIELSLSLADGMVVISRANENGHAGPGWQDFTYSEHYISPQTGFSIAELTPQMFSFNSPHGACSECAGLGTTLFFNPELVVPDESLPLTSAIAPWATPKSKGSGKSKLAANYAKQLKTLCNPFEVKPDTPFEKLPSDLRRIILHGATNGDKKKYGLEFEGVLPNMERRHRAAGNDSSRSKLTAYQSQRVCAACQGARLKPEPLSVRIDGRNIAEMSSLTIDDAVSFFDGVSFTGEASAIAEPILREVRQRVHFMQDVGLGYLTLDRASATLSGGEAQRIRLATQLGSGLVGVCYVLDEPTIGLHQRDNARLLNSIRNLVEIGNTVLVVEHDEDVILAADHLIDIGPGAGLHGGRVIAEGSVQEALANPASITGRYLRGEYTIELPDERRSTKKSNTLQVLKAAENNLQEIDVSIPLGCFCAITGVSGSGKSTLISQILLPALRRRLHGSREVPGRHERLVGAHRIDKVVEVDQAPIGRTPRSNPATYTGAFDEIRRLYAKTKEARIRGYGASRFSFNAKGGRCEACQGQGVRRIEMHFLPDVFVECEACSGTRYNRETLEVRYRGKSIADVLEMRVEEALPFFDSFPKIKQGLRALSDVGLGYIRLGQPSNTLSGGEAQRVKLAAELAGPSTGHTLYVLDEPTTGLHFADIQQLLSVLNRLVDRGNSVLVIEHNLDVVKTVDWIIDLGPEGGSGGGTLVVTGTPEDVADCEASHTGRYLKEKLARDAANQAAYASEDS